MKFVFGFALISLLWGPASFAANALKFNTSTTKFQFFDGAIWEDIGSSTDLGACSVAGKMEYDGGLTTYKGCDGTHWLDLGVENTGASCSSAGQLEYNSGLGVYRFCNGTQWMATYVPVPIDFADLTNQALGATVESEILRMTGFSGAKQLYLSVNMPGTPQVRICSDASCATVVTNWTTPMSYSSISVSGGQYVQIRRQVSGTVSTSRALDIHIGSITDSWTITSTSTGDNTPDSFDFLDKLNQPTGSEIYSDILQITGMTAADVSIDYPMFYRICADATCASVVTNWTYRPETILGNQYIQLRSYSLPAGTQVSGTLTIGTVSDSWAAGTATAPGVGAFVWIRNQIIYGDTFGSLAGADAWCLDKVSTLNFAGKQNVTIDASHVRAFLCDDTTCNNLLPNSTYVYATTWGEMYGGTTFTTNASGQGPGDAVKWSDNNTLRLTGEIATGRAPGSATYWSNLPSGKSCSNWSSLSGTVTEGEGYNTTGSDRWNKSESSCSWGTFHEIICYVNP